MQWPGLKGMKLIKHNWRDFLKLHEGRGPRWVEETLKSSCFTGSWVARHRRAALATVRWLFGYRWNCKRVMESLWFSGTLLPYGGGKAVQALGWVHTTEPSSRVCLFFFLPQMCRLSKVAMHRSCSIGWGRIFLINCIFVILDFPSLYLDDYWNVSLPSLGRTACNLGTHRLLWTQGTPKGGCHPSTADSPAPPEQRSLPGQQELQGQPMPPRF